ncbi:MAG: SDR family oxidoreductase [Thermoflavifilum sp.]|nr:SDR family oxidoreductase [Thermoflavifilum sp.]
MSALLITGASGGLGIPVTRRLLQEGWEIHAAVHDRQSRDRLQELFSEKSLQVSMIDITHQQEVQGWVSQASDVVGLIHLAGGFRGGEELSNSTDEDYEFLFGLHARATFYVLAAVMPIFKAKRQGVIITIGARTAIRPGRQAALYAASKAAEITLTMAAAEEGRSYGIRANCIIPAVIRTPANIEGASQAEIAKWTAPEDIAELIAFLVSERGKSITGAQIPMYGGIPA